VPFAARDAFGSELLSAAETARNSVVAATRIGRAYLFDSWVAFTASLSHDPFLLDIPRDAHIDFFIVYACRYRRGLLSRSSQPVGAKRVEEALRAVGQEFSRLGHPDPRLDGVHYVFRLKTLFKAWADEDPTPSRVWPVNITILRALVAGLSQDRDQARAQAILDLSTFAFFFLCRPGEYALSPATDRGRSQPFRLADTTFSTALVQRIPACDGSLHDVQQGTYVSLTYTDQKNCTRGEALGHGVSGDNTLCPVHALRRRVTHLRQFDSPPDSPLYRYFDTSGRPHNITTRDITAALRRAAAAVYHITNIPPERIEAYSLRSGGATALLVSGIDQTAIRALGRWKSDSIFLYLRTQPSRLTSAYSRAMLDHGQYTFSPSAETYADKDLLPRETPPYLTSTLQAAENVDLNIPP
jgi:hypothetical protein